MSDREAPGLVSRLRAYADDPMWADHGEVPKPLLQEAATRLAEAEAAVERLTHVLVDADEILAESDQDPQRDPAIQDVVDQIGHRVGYGALMYAAAHGWRNSLDEWSRGGEFAIGPCRTVLSKLRRTIRAALTDTASADRVEAAMQTLADEGQKYDAAPSAGDVERVAEAIWVQGYGRHHKDAKWPDDVIGGSQELFRDYARAAIAALSPDSAGDVRRRALEEAAQWHEVQAADLESKADGLPVHWAAAANNMRLAAENHRQDAASIRALIATPSAPTVEAAMERVFDAAISWYFASNRAPAEKALHEACSYAVGLRALSQQESGA